MQYLHQLSPEQLAATPLLFQDDRLNQLLFRFRARNYPHSLNYDELQKWQRYCHDKLTLGLDNPSLTLEEFTIALENAVEQHQGNEKKLQLLQSLYRFVAGG